MSNIYSQIKNIAQNNYRDHDLVATEVQTLITEWIQGYRIENVPIDQNEGFIAGNNKLVKKMIIDLNQD